MGPPVLPSFLHCDFLRLLIVWYRSVSLIIALGRFAPNLFFMSYFTLNFVEQLYVFSSSNTCTIFQRMPLSVTYSNRKIVPPSDFGREIFMTQYRTRAQYRPSPDWSDKPRPCPRGQTIPHVFMQITTPNAAYYPPVLTIPSLQSHKAAL